MNDSESKVVQTGTTDCSEAMEAKIADKARELFKLSQAVGKSASGFVHYPGAGLVRIRIDAMADDAVNRAVQKTHPENQKEYFEQRLQELAKEFCDICDLKKTL